jgi:membrane associated rhomboid family serine protease
MQRWPIANWVLIGLTTLVSLVVFVNPTLAESLALWRDEFSVIQLVGYLGVHAGPVHLAGNMMFLFCFGNAVNARLGHAQFLILYFLLGVIAGAAWLFLGRGDALAGASGAIMGITGVFFVLYPRNEVSVLYWIFIRAAGAFQLSSYWVVLFYMAFDVWGTLFADDEVAYVCHLGGELFGAAIAVALLALGFYKATADEENLLQVLGLQKRIKRHQHIDSYGRRIG